MSITIRIHKPDTPQWLSAPLRAEFHGPKATVTTTMLEFDGEKLRSSKTNNSRRFVPEDPLWWLEFMEPDAPEYIDVSGELING